VWRSHGGGARGHFDWWKSLRAPIPLAFRRRVQFFDLESAVILIDAAGWLADML
jgi:hypothetical protein